MLTLLEQLLDDTELPKMVSILNAKLDDEHRRREQFYEDLRADQKAEFINGEVVRHSPAKAKHLKARENLERLLGTFVAVRQVGEVHSEKALCSFTRNDYEPDICFFSETKAASITAETVKFPVPDFAVEVLSDSTERKDRGVKFRDYAAHAVREYWIIDADDELVEQYLLKGTAYELRLKSGSGEIESAVVSGFRIPIRAIFDGEENLRVLRQILTPA